MPDTSQVTKAIGQTENLLGALLRQTIGGLAPEEWIALNLLAPAGRSAREHAVQRIVASSHAASSMVENAIAALIARGYLALASDEIELSQEGREALNGLRQRVGEATSHLLDDVSDTDVETLVQTLAAVRRQAEAALARGRQ
jgi:hypothetical protein